MANRLDPGLDLSGALEAVRKAGSPAEQTAEAEGAGVKFVNLRFREADYKRLGHLAADAGMSKAAFCKMAALYVAALAESGVFSVSGGGIVEKAVRRGRDS